MADIITTLHPENDNLTNLYPNIKKINIPTNSIDYNKLDDDVKSLLDSINELHPSGVDTSTNILAYTTDKGIYIGSNTGHWYYWNGTQYADGGVYQATAIASGSIVLSQLADSLKNILFYAVGALNTNIINDLNDASLKNTIYRLTSPTTQEQLANCPFYPFQGVIYTLYSGDENVCWLQIVQPSSGTLYFRTKWAAWSSWKTLVDSNNFSTFFSNILSIDAIIKEYGYGSYSNLNNVPRNSVISYTSTIDITNLPEDGDGNKYQGVLLTFGSNDITKTQIFNTTNNITFTRRLWGANWSSWKKIIDTSSIDDYLTEGRNILPMFNNLTFIGDSLTYSQVYTSASTSRQAKQTYPQIVGKLSGIENINAYAFGGATSKTWWETYNQNLVARENNLYIIYLGTNGGLTNTIDTDCPDDEPISNYADTQTGYYGRILKTIYDLGEKAILIKVHSSTGDVSITNTTIENFGTKFDFPVIDNEYLSNIIYHYYPDLSGSNGTHYNDLGYSVFANNVIKKISNLNDTMFTRLIKEHN